LENPKLFNGAHHKFMSPPVPPIQVDMSNLTDVLPVFLVSFAFYRATAGVIGNTLPLRNVTTATTLATTAAKLRLCLV
jgi:hypothetical protein